MKERKINRYFVKEPESLDEWQILKKKLDREQHIGLILSFAAIAFLLVSFSVSRKPPMGTATFPDTDPHGISCAPCVECYVPSFLARTVDALVVAGAKPYEIRDFMLRTYTESGYDHEAVSPTGDHGLPQFNKKAHPEIDMERLKSDPKYVVSVWLPYYRKLVASCGDQWQCCYRHGINGGCKKYGR